MNAKARGFTLIELMTAVAVVAILATIAYPSYQAQMQKTRRADGQAMLNRIMHAQERYYTMNNTYVTTLSTLGYSVDANGKVTSDAGYYRIGAASCGASIASCVMLTATRQDAQAGDSLCGDLTLDSLGQKGKTGTATSWRGCW